MMVNASTQRVVAFATALLTKLSTTLSSSDEDDDDDDDNDDDESPHKRLSHVSEEELDPELDPLAEDNNNYRYPSPPPRPQLQ